MLKLFIELCEKFFHKNFLRKNENEGLKWISDPCLTSNMQLNVIFHSQKFIKQMKLEAHTHHFRAFLWEIKNWVINRSMKFVQEARCLFWERQRTRLKSSCNFVSIVIVRGWWWRKWRVSNWKDKWKQQVSWIYYYKMKEYSIWNLVDLNFFGNKNS